MAVSVAYVIVIACTPQFTAEDRWSFRQKPGKRPRIDKGDVVLVEPEGDGRILLIRLERPNHAPVKVKVIHRRGKHPVGDIGRPITRDEIKNALADFP